MTSAQAVPTLPQLIPRRLMLRVRIQGDGGSTLPIALAVKWRGGEYGLRTAMHLSRRRGQQIVISAVAWWE
jgi:hypothetical protein